FSLRAGTIILAISIVIWALCYYPRPTEIKERYEKERAVVQAKLDALPPEDKKDDKKEAAKPEAAKEEPKKEAPKKEEAADKGDKKPDGEAKAEEKPDPRKELQDKLDELDKLEKGEYLRQSVMGRMGHAVEPVVKPLGWDWKIGMAAIASF